MNRWIRARITVTDEYGREKTFTDVGAHELKKIKSKYKNAHIANDNDWGRFLEPRNEEDAKEKDEIKKILKI